MNLETAAWGAGLETEVQQLRLPFPSAPEHLSRVTQPRLLGQLCQMCRAPGLALAMLSLCPLAALHQEQLLEQLGGAGCS